MKYKHISKFQSVQEVSQSERIKNLLQKHHIFMPGMVAHICNPSIQEAEASRSQV
jgi:hypothetical protein